jgi:hypothetical protein
MSITSYKCNVRTNIIKECSFSPCRKEAQSKHGQIEFYNAVNNIDVAELARATGQVWAVAPVLAMPFLPFFRFTMGRTLLQVDSQEAARTAKEREEELRLAEASSLVDVQDVPKDEQVSSV